MTLKTASTSPNPLPACDIVLPVYNGLGYVRRCIESLLANTPESLYKLWIIDDASDGMTSAYLQEVTAQNSQFNLLRNAENLGFVKSCNKGIEQGSLPFTLLLNSDVIVTPKWLETLLACAAQDKQIASVNPLTNHAANINLPMAAGLSFLDMHQRLQKHAPRKAIDIVTGVGFCLLLRREALDDVGLFDEVFGAGYCEESDLCMRLLAKNWRTVLAPNVYVYHKGSGSFSSERDERYLKNRAIFDERHGKEYRQLFKAFKKENALAELHDLFAAGKVWAPKPALRNMARKMRFAYRERDWERVAKEAAKGGIATLRAFRPCVNEVYFLSIKPMTPPRLRVTYVLPTLAVAGGVLSVIQLVNEMILMGIDARIAAVYEQEGIRNWPMLAEPMMFRSPEDLIANLPESDVILATHWMTADWVKRMDEQSKAKQAVYFLQDYESWFYPKSQSAKRKAVKKSYALIEEKIVKSTWLASMLAKDGYATHKIRLGMNLDVFYPRHNQTTDTPTIMTMFRPSTPQRGHATIIEAFKRIKKARPDVKFLLFGENVAAETLPFEAEIAGAVTDQSDLAKLYSRADLFLDGSTFQGFGRPALEAMACGTACVLTNVGGVNEYAVDSVNCLLVPPSEPQAIADALLKLLDSADLRTKLSKGGLTTAKDYCMRREARDTLRYFADLMSEPTLNQKTGTDGR